MTGKQQKGSAEVVRLHGVIQRIYPERGFGFIRPVGSVSDIFFHMTGLDGCDMRDLQEGSPVDYEQHETPKGPRAELVRLA